MKMRLNVGQIYTPPPKISVQAPVRGGPSSLGKSGIKPSAVNQAPAFGDNATTNSMPRPFPFPINIGTDICSIDRIYNILKRTSGLRFVRRVLIERERHEALERLDAPLERWRLAGRVGSILDWKRREMGLSPRELEKRRLQVEMKKEVLDTAEKDIGGEGGKIKSRIREGLRKELEREIKFEKEAERRLALENKRIQLDEEMVEFARGIEEAAAKRAGEEIDASVEPVQDVVDKKEAEIRKWEETPEQLKQRRLDDADLIIRLMDDHLKELKTAEGELWKAAEFLAGRYVLLLLLTYSAF